MPDLLIDIRYARAGDAEGLCAVHDAAWREAYRGVIPALTLEAMIARRGPRWWAAAIRRGRLLAVLEVDRRLAGYVSYGRCRTRSALAEGEIDELYLAPEYQGLGFGRRLFRAARNDLKARGFRRTLVWALADNERARAFYERLGGRAAARATERMGAGPAAAPIAKIAYLFD